MEIENAPNVDTCKNGEFIKISGDPAGEGTAGEPAWGIATAKLSR